MRKLVLLVVILSIFAACPERPSWQTNPVSEAGEKTYPVRGTIVSRDGVSNMLTVKHETIEGFMEAMTMEFTVRGAAVATLPADGARIEATLHVVPGKYWLSDVRAASGQ